MRLAMTASLCATALGGSAARVVLGCCLGNNDLSNGNDTHSILPQATIIRGRHSIKGGR